MPTLRKEACLLISQHVPQLLRWAKEQWVWAGFVGGGQGLRAGSSSPPLNMSDPEGTRKKSTYHRHRPLNSVTTTNHKTTNKHWNKKHYTKPKRSVVQFSHPVSVTRTISSAQCGTVGIFATLLFLHPHDEVKRAHTCTSLKHDWRKTANRHPPSPSSSSPSATAATHAGRNRNALRLSTGSSQI